MSSIWDGRVVTFQYTSHRGVDEQRRAVPRDLVFKESEYYPKSGRQWFVVSWDLDRQAPREFMLSRMLFIDKDEDQSLPWRQS